MVAVSDEGQFGLAASVLGISQQAVSKRIAKLEGQLGAPLFERRIGNVALTAHGARFLPHARSILASADAAIAAVRDSQVLRVAVHGAQIADANLMRFYLEKHPDAEVELIMMGPSTTSRNAVIDCRVDIAFARPHWHTRPLPAHITAVPAYLGALHLLVGNGHPLADRDHVEFDDLDGLTAWVPGAGFDSEVGDFYGRLSESCGITITTEQHPGGIGFANIVDRIADSTTLVTFGGEGTTTPWHPNIRRIPIVNPTPAYPMALLWRETITTHPQFTSLIDFITGSYNGKAVSTMWIPEPDRALFQR
ncbi:LysR family transcriptional regulator [Nocardia donostiensis]|uniref:LysR family transcriptional regulator n=2 Tax=Nocardia donostiensis TaxID=1538463 RepID=A0A1W0B0R5_9NOCA|nr:LysR family transcriptional regulator [Nocardia donostiensis]OQS12458.1 LysR family transcriptional regulator [Nocardia donostiensis]OQS16088.1 LysR family transcriptional regulator [Nocardia donostiensis]